VCYWRSFGGGKSSNLLVNDTSFNRSLLVQILGWPKCRDSTVTGCAVSSTNPELPSADLTVSNIDTTVNIGTKVQVSCADSAKITDSFESLELKCQYDGLFTVPTINNYTLCREPTECSASPSAPADTNLVATDLGVEILLEHEKQEYACNDGFTLSGVQHKLVTDAGKAEIPCIKDDAGAFMAPTSWTPEETWPVCLAVVTECTSYPNLGGFSSSSALPVNVAATVTLFCTDTSTKSSYILVCLEWVTHLIF
jgi:hypothetical protein